MDPERWNKIELLCYEVRDLEGEDRRTYLLNSCGDDMELFTEVLSLLEQDNTGSLPQPFVYIQSSSVFSDEKSLPDKLIGPYRLIREISSGGMGQIFLAVRNDDQFERFVALKVIRKERVNDIVLKRFYEERQILATLNHPNIARLFDGGTTEEGMPWFAMEYVEGVPVTDYLHQKPLSIPDKIRLFLDVCSAVHFAHQNLIIHRDLKPENILITGKGEPKLLDFGIAKLMDIEQKRGQTLYQNRIMTPEYASPEQVRHDTISTASDVYALGVLLYHLLTGSLPYDFDKRTPSEIEKTVCSTIPKLPSAKAGLKTLKGDLDSVIMKALKKDPVERYPSVEQFAADLSRYLEDRPVLARKESASYQVKKFITRNRWGVTVSAAVTLLALSFTIITFLQSRAIRERAIEAEQQRDRAEQVSRFLTDLFNSVNPDKAEDNALTAIELLNRGADRVDTELTDQPELQAGLYLVISDVYEKLGLFDEGMALAEKSYSLNTELYGITHPETARSLNTMGWLHRQLANYEMSDSLLTAALNIRRDIYGASHPDIARSLNDLAVLKQSRGDYAAADSLLLESITIRQSLSDEPEEALGVSLSNHAALKYGLGEFEAAESQMKEALAIFLETAGTRDMRTANVMSNLAAILMVRNKMDEAIEYYEQALTIRSGILSPEHPDIASSYAHLGNLYRRTGRFDDAETFLSQTLILREGSLVEEHELIFDTKRLLGLLYDNMGNEEEAENYYSEAAEGFLRLNPAGHNEAAETLHNLGSLYLRKLNPLEAEPYLRNALGMRERILGPDHELTLRTLVSLGICVAELDDYNQSRVLLKSALARLDESGMDSPELRNLAVNALSDLEDISQQ